MEDFSMKRIKKVAFLKIYDIWLETKAFMTSRKSITSLHTSELLEKEEYDFKLTEKTFLLDIKEDLDIIFKNMDYKSARYAINKAVRDEVVIRKIQTPEEEERYLTFQTQFCREKGIPILDRTELSNLNCYYAVSKEDEYLGACAFLESSDKKIVRYKYGATQHKLNANEIILWKAICDYHKQGYEIFDFGGCVVTEDKESYYYRHYQFKKKFGGKLSECYTYFKIKGPLKIFFYFFLGIVKVFFKGDVNSFTNLLNKYKILH